MDEEQGDSGQDVIDLMDDHQVRQWSEIFDITPANLAFAVHLVGPKAANVKRYIRERKRH